MINEIWRTSPADEERALEEMVVTLAEKLNAPRCALCNSGFVDCVLSTCWSWEEKVAPEVLEDKIRTCRLFYQDATLL